MGSVLFSNFMITLLFLALILCVLFQKKRSDSGASYTPFDYITGQTDKEFHVESEEGKSDENE